jgi:hypothetical protein
LVSPDVAEVPLRAAVAKFEARRITDAWSQCVAVEQHIAVAKVQRPSREL